MTDFYYCLQHSTVEERGQCRADDRLGPYPTREAAEHALAALHERNERLDAEDRAWEEGTED